MTLRCRKCRYCRQAISFYLCDLYEVFIMLPIIDRTLMKLGHTSLHAHIQYPSHFLFFHCHSSEGILQDTLQSDCYLPHVDNETYTILFSCPSSTALSGITRQEERLLKISEVGWLELLEMMILGILRETKFKPPTSNCLIKPLHQGEREVLVREVILTVAATLVFNN